MLPSRITITRLLLLQVSADTPRDERGGERGGEVYNGCIVLLRSESLFHYLTHWLNSQWQTSHWGFVMKFHNFSSLSVSNYTRNCNSNCGTDVDTLNSFAEKIVVVSFS